jgi:hypothetical protein
MDHEASATLPGTGALYAAAITVRTRKELIAAFQQQPPPQRIVVESRTLVGLALVAMLWFQGIPFADGLIRTAMEKGYGIKVGWTMEKLKITGEIVFTPPPELPVERAPGTGEE